MTQLSDRDWKFEVKGEKDFVVEPKVAECRREMCLQTTPLLHDAEGRQCLHSNAAAITFSRTGSFSKLFLMVSSCCPVRFLAAVIRGLIKVRPLKWRLHPRLASSKRPSTTLSKPSLLAIPDISHQRLYRECAMQLSTLKWSWLPGRSSAIFAACRRFLMDWITIPMSSTCFAMEQTICLG